MKNIKRAAISTLLLAGVFSLGIWTGRSSATILPSRTELLDEMNQARKTQETIGILQRELSREQRRRIAEDPLHRYGGQVQPGKKN